MDFWKLVTCIEVQLGHYPRAITQSILGCICATTQNNNFSVCKKNEILKETTIFEPFKQKNNFSIEKDIWTVIFENTALFI